MPILALILAALLLPGTGFGPDLNVAPYAHFTCSPESGPAPLEVAFSATTSSDPDGDIDMFRWSFGDRSSSSEPSIVHTFSDPGSYDVTLVVMDDRGAMGTFTQTVQVLASELLASELLAIGDTGWITGDAEHEAQTGSYLPSTIEFASNPLAIEDIGEQASEAPPPSAGDSAPEEDARIIEVTLHDARFLHALGGFRIPELGSIYVVVYVEVASRGPRLSVALFDFQLVDAGGRVTKPDPSMGCLHRPLEPAVIRAGQRAEGEVLFEVHRSRHYTLEYGEMLGAPIRFRFSL